MLRDGGGVGPVPQGEPEDGEWGRHLLGSELPGVRQLFRHDGEVLAKIEGV